MPLNDVPLAAQSLNQTQNPIRTNFQVIDTAFSVNHVDYNAPGDQGKHKWVAFPVQAGVPVFLANEEGLYNRLLAGRAELYVHKQSFAGVREIPMTNSTLSTSTPAANVGGFTWLPSGYYQTFGDGNGNGLTTVTLTSPPPTRISNVQLTPASNAIVYQNIEVRFIDVLSNSQFRIFVSVNGVAALAGFNFFVTGY